MFGKISKPHFDKGWDAPYHAKGTYRKVKTDYIKLIFNQNIIIIHLSRSPMKDSVGDPERSETVFFMGLKQQKLF